MGLFDRFKKTKEPAHIEIGLSGDDLEKSVKPVPNTSFLDQQIDKSKAIFSLDSKSVNVDNIYQKKGRLQDKDLRELSQYDSIISLIVNTRAEQSSVFGRKSRSKYDRGFILRERIPIQEDMYTKSEDREQEARSRTELSNHICKWVQTCGTANRFVVDYAFSGSDSFFKECSLSEFLAAQSRNLIVFGRCATQIIRNNAGVPIMFRPVPVESLFRVIDQRIVSISGSDRDVSQQAVLDADEYAAIEKGRRPIAYVQRMDGKNVSFFTDQDIILTYHQKQAYENLDGYPLAPIEQATYMIGLHFHAQNFMQNSMTKGLASKGIISLKTPDGGVVSPEQSEHFRKMFSNYVARNDNSATIPVISGPIDVNFIELNATVHDLEFLNLYNKAIMILCSSFQISPQEIGFGNLDSAQPSLGDSSKQDQIVQGEERGLRQIIEKLFAVLNKVIHETFAESAGMFEFEAIGLGQNTREADLAVYKEELQTTGTFGKLWADSERVEAFPFGGNVPTSPLFVNSVAKFMTYGHMMYYFFGVKDALDKPEYDFLLDVGLDQAYQNMKFGVVKMQAEQLQIQTEQLRLQLEMTKQQMQQMPVQAEMEQAQAEQQMGMDQQAQQQETVEKSTETKQKAMEFLQRYKTEKEQKAQEAPKTLSELFNNPV